MALPNFPTLVKRLVKGSQVTHAEGDANLDAIKSYCEMLASLFGVALNPDGTLNTNSVPESAIADRQVTERKLGPISVFGTKLDAGSTNALRIAITPPLTAYGDGQVFFIKAANTNTGPTTLWVDNISAGAVAIKKRGVVDLEAGDIEAGSVVAVTYYGGVFHLSSGSGNSSSSGGGSSDGFSGFQVYESTDVSIPPESPIAATGTLVSNNTIPTDGDTVTIGAVTYTFKTALTPTAGQVLIAGSADAALLNLIRAINHTGTPGTDYANLGATAIAHPTVSADPAVTAHTITVTALTPGIGGNSINTSENDGSTGRLTWGAANLTGGVTDPYINFTHGLTNKPGIYDAYLVCIDADLGRAVGVEISTSEFTDSAGLPAFTVSADSSSVTVERYPVSIELGGAGAIDESKWLLRVRASVVLSAAGTIFPAVTFAVKQPVGAFANGSDLFMCLTGANNSNITYIQRLALANNNITLLDRDTGVTNPQGICCAPFKKVDGSNHFIFTSTTGVYSIPMLEVAAPEWKPVRLTSGLAYNYRPVHIVESGGNVTEVYVMTSVYGISTVSAIPAYLINTGTGAVSLYGAAIDLTSALILSADGTAGNIQFRRWHQSASGASPLLIQFNKIKMRLYVISNEDHCLHIFKVNTSTDWKMWWDKAVATRAGELQYVKTIGIGGDGAAYGGDANDRIYIDVNLDNGDERAIIFSRTGNSAKSGSVTRVPWKE